MKPSQRLSLSLLLLTAPAFAQVPDAQRTAPLRPALLAIDTDQDGQFSVAEIAAASAGLIDLDTDHDGQLTSLEYLPSQSDPAATKPDETVQRLMSLDKNGDRTLTKDEVPERLQGLFTRADTNHDGKLTPDEIRASASTQSGPNGRAQRSGEATRMDPVLNAIDTNHDGIISKDEIAAAPTTLKSLDKDGDGELSAAELRPRQQTPADRAHHLLDEWDTNKDGKLTRPEAPDRIQQQFDAIDINHDRVLSEEELVQYFTNTPQPPRRPESTANNAAPKLSRIATLKLMNFSPTFSKTAALLLLSLAIPSAIAQAPSALHVYHHENVLGTSLELKLRTATDAQAKHAEAAVLREIDRENRILSAWSSTSEFSRWTRTHNTPVRVSPELFEVLNLFDHWRQSTGGALDASAETAVRTWKLAAVENREPTDAELLNAVTTMQRPHWSTDPVHHTATHIDDAPIALNSFVKSYISGHAADAALAAGATGVLLNIGGDIVLRGSITERVAITDPRATAENDPPIDLLRLSNRTIATSGDYRRGVDIHGTHYSHIIDPRTAEPAEDVLSSTVIARDPATAGALATAFSVMSPAQSRRLTASLPDVDYLLILRDGRTITSANWSSRELPRIQVASYSQTKPAAAPMDLLITLELARIDDPRYRRPYVAVWVEDADHFPVRTLALWFQKPRWLPDLKSWYHSDQVRNLAEGSDISTTLSAATRSPGKYTLRWDGNDNAGKPVKPGKYTIFIEAAREHGTYGLMKQEINWDGKTTAQFTLPGNTEIASASLDYGKHN